MPGEAAAEPFVSLVVAAYNAARTLPPLFASLERLDHPRERFEIIVVDMTSTSQSSAWFTRSA